MYIDKNKNWIIEKDNFRDKNTHIHRLTYFLSFSNFKN